MAGESPLNIMRSAARPVRKRTPAPRPHRRLRAVFWLTAMVIVVAVGWSWLWYYAASIADRALAGWIDREAALGRVYACGAQSIGGFPFSIVTRCGNAAAAFNSNRPPFDVRATDIAFSAQVFRPTLLHGEITGPVTLADPGQPPIFVANWSRAQITLLGLPPEPERVGIALRQPRLDRVAGAGTGLIFQADRVEVDGRIVGGSARNNPVIEATGHFAAATAPSFHPLLAEPLSGDIDVTLRGFKDFSPKPWPALFRDMQASGGGIEIKSLRIERADAIIVGTGTLTVNEHGKLDGLIRVAVAGVENIVPLLGIDQLIGQGIDRLTGGSGSSAQVPGAQGLGAQGLGALDRLVPGLSGVVREGANASLIENIKKMGQPTEIDKKPAVALPLRVTDGIIFLGLIPLGVVPPLF
jgi:hypothetical protein